MIAVILNLDIYL